MYNKILYCSVSNQKEESISIQRVNLYLQDCVSQLRRVCTFLDIDRPDTFLQEVADKNDVNTIKAVKEKNPELSQFIKATSTDGTLHFYRKGKY